MKILNDRREQKRFAKFAVVGTIGAGVDFVVFNLVAFLFGLPEVYSQAVSFLAAVTSNFILNRHWTFPDSRSKKVSIQVGQYALVNFIGLLIRTPMFTFLSSLLVRMLAGLQIPFGLEAEWLAHNLALAGAIGVVLFWNFFVNRYWTYADVD